MLLPLPLGAYPPSHLPLQGYAGYDIAEPETVSLVVPGAALASGRPVVATPAYSSPFVLSAARGVATLSGSVVEEHDVDVIQSVQVLLRCLSPPSHSQPSPFTAAHSPAHTHTHPTRTRLQHRSRRSPRSSPWKP